MLVWSPGKGSPIHDHGNAHCLMKILKGDLTETRYAFPHGAGEEPMKIISEKTHPENAVAYMADELGVHKVWNRGGDFAVSLHCEWRPRDQKAPAMTRADMVQCTRRPTSPREAATSSMRRQADAPTLRNAATTPLGGSWWWTKERFGTYTYPRSRAALFLDICALCLLFGRSRPWRLCSNRRGRG